MSKRIVSLLLVFGCCFGGLVRGGEASNTKLIVSASASESESESEAGATLADLLTAELARLPGVVMLERQELGKIVAEQKLAADSAGALVKAGGLLGADAIVALDSRKLASRTRVAMRLMSVRRGVSLGWWDCEIGGEGQSAWAKGAGDVLARMLRKLSLSDTSTPAISFVGFASPSSSRSGIGLERMVSSLILNRLVAEPDLLVLERQRLLDAALEKMISGDDRRFWNGAYLLDGTLNSERIDSRVVSVHARLAAPGGAATDIVMEGSRTNLSELGDRFVAAVRQALKAKPSLVRWAPAVEAGRYYDEAVRAARWKFWPEARAAAETALALGKDDLDTRRLRLRALTGLFKQDENETTMRNYKPGVGVLEAYTVPPAPGALMAAVDAADQLVELVRSPDAFKEREARAEVEETLEALAWLTLKFYLGAELRIGHEESLLRLRGTMREVTEALLGAQAGDTDTFLVLLGRFGPLWFETPEEGIVLHKRLRSLAGFGAHEGDAWALGQFDSSEDAADWTPSLCGWKWEDRSRCERLWEAFRRLPPQPSEAPAPASVSGTVAGPSSRPPQPLNPQQAGKLPALTMDVLTLENTSGVTVFRVVWAEERLWVYYEADRRAGWSTPTQGGTVLKHEFFVVGFDGTGRGDRYQVPDKFLSSSERTDQADLAIVSGRACVVLEGQILILNPKDGTFSAKPAPLKSARAFSAGGRLFLYNEESLLETNEEVGNFKVLASVRRRPVLTYLDEMEAFTKPNLFRAGGRIVFEAGGRLHELRGDGWQPIAGIHSTRIMEAGEVLSVRSFMNENLVRDQVRLEDNRIAHRAYYFGDGATAELWWGGIVVRSLGATHGESVVPEPGPVLAQYTNLPASAPFYYLQGRFGGLHRNAVFAFQHRLLTLRVGMEANAHPVLQIWPTNGWQSAEVLLTLEGQGRDFRPSIVLGGGQMFLWSPAASNIFRADGRAIFAAFEKATSIQKHATDERDRRMASLSADGRHEFLEAQVLERSFAQPSRRDP